MKDIDIIDHHLIIRETVGYEILNDVDIFDMPKVMEFLKIMYNYNRMKRVEKEEQKGTGWFDEKAMIQTLLSDRSYAEGFYYNDHSKPQYKYKDIYYVLNRELTKILKTYTDA
jgi:hypothetical protein